MLNQWLHGTLLAQIFGVPVLTGTTDRNWSDPWTAAVINFYTSAARARQIKVGHGWTRANNDAKC